MGETNDSGLIKIRRALISVSDKTGIVDFARDLRTFDVEIISTGGTAKTLRDNGIDVTALHNHMLDDQPRIFFMHFWANDDAGKLAKGLRAALDKTNVPKKFAQK